MIDNGIIFTNAPESAKNLCTLKVEILNVKKMEGIVYLLPTLKF